MKRNKKGQGSMMIALSIGAIMLIVVFAVMADFLNPAYTIQSVFNESVAFSATNGTLANDNVVTFTQLENATLVIPAAKYTVTNILGTIHTNSSASEDIVNTTTYLATYSYQDDIYVTSSAGRTLIAILPVLLALAIFVFIAGFLALRSR
jgi:hypothetical protein